MKQSIVLFIQTPKAETIIHESDIDSFFTKIYSTIMTKIKKKISGRKLGLDYWLSDRTKY